MCRQFLLLQILTLFVKPASNLVDFPRVDGNNLSTILSQIATSKLAQKLLRLHECFAVFVVTINLDQNLFYFFHFTLRHAATQSCQKIAKSLCDKYFLKILRCVSQFAGRFCFRFLTFRHFSVGRLDFFFGTTSSVPGQQVKCRQVKHFDIYWWL